MGGPRVQRWAPVPLPRRALQHQGGHPGPLAVEKKNLATH